MLLADSTLVVAVQIIGAAIAGIGLLGGFAAAFFGYTKAKGNEQAISILTEANAGLIAVNEELRRHNTETTAILTEKLRLQELDCTKQIAVLEGKVQALTEGLAREVVNAVKQAMDAAAKTTTSTKTVESKTETIK